VGNKLDKAGCDARPLSKRYGTFSDDPRASTLVRAAMPDRCARVNGASIGGGPSRHAVGFSVGSRRASRKATRPHDRTTARPHDRTATQPAGLTTASPPPIRAVSTERSMIPQTLPAIASLYPPARTAEDPSSLL
jgi:hypothetical protein